MWKKPGESPKKSGHWPHIHIRKAFSLSPTKAFSNLTHSLTAGQKRKGRCPEGQRSILSGLTMSHRSSRLVLFGLLLLLCPECV